MSCTLNEISGDLFNCPKTTSMAHCVSADMKMGKGIAIKFRDVFGKIQNLKSQNIQPGGVAILKDEKRFIYYLVTKKFSFHKPTYQCLASSLEAMKIHIINNNVNKLAIPRIACGLDGLDWSKVKDLIYEIFLNVHIEITVYNYSAKIK